MNQEILVPVFYPRSVISSGNVLLADARLLVREGHAQWINRCRAIRVLREGFDFRGLSCAFRPDAGLSTSPEIRAAINSYGGS